MTNSKDSRRIALLGLLIVLLMIVISGQHYAAAKGQEELIQSDTSLVPRRFMPLIMKQRLGLSPLPPPVAFETTPPLNPQQLATTIPASWELGLNKIGFHTGPNSNEAGLDDWMRELDSAGVPFFLKSVDHAGRIYQAQEMMKASGVPHTLVFRTTKWGHLSDGYDYDVPNYELPPKDAAQIHWEAHKAKFPPELDQELVWIETINEVDRNRSEWLADFALETGRLALRDGYRWAAFGWASGVPEKSHWESPRMLEFLRFAAQHPEDIAVALHEYSYEVNHIGAGYPYLIGRFQALFDVCDNNNIPRPTILITEWGWTYDKIPGPTEAMADIEWASHLYAAYPTIKGAAIWYLGGGFGDIKNLTQRLIAPAADYSLSNYFWVASGQGATDPSLFPPPEPRPDLVTLPYAPSEFRPIDPRSRHSLP